MPLIISKSSYSIFRTVIWNSVLNKRDPAGIWGILGSSLIANDLNSIIGEALSQNVANDARLASSKVLQYCINFKTFCLKLLRKEGCFKFKVLLNPLQLNQENPKNADSIILALDKADKA